MLKVLFVSSGNSPEISDENGVLPLTKNQGESLRDNGVDIDYFTIKGKGLKGYFKNILLLNRYIHEGNYDLIHAHYSLSGIVASLASNKPVVVSLMGSDIKTCIFIKFAIRYFCNLRFKATIVKSQRMKNDLGIPKAHVIPNGVDLKKFKFIEKEFARRKVGFSINKKHIIFVASTSQSVKNFPLAKKAYKLLNNTKIELNLVSFVDKDEMPYYMNAADVLLLTSFWEGSPNVIKEAMACNLPIVSTDVGDVREIISDTIGCYITSYEPEDVANKLKRAISFGEKTNGRENIRHLDVNIIAKEIDKIYHNSLSR